MEEVGGGEGVKCSVQHYFGRGFELLWAGTRFQDFVMMGKSWPASPPAVLRPRTIQNRSDLSGSLA